MHGSVNFSCPRFFLLLNMNAVMVVRHCGDFLSLKVAEGFVDWFSCWTRALNNSRSSAGDIFAIHHSCVYIYIYILIHLKRVVIMIFVLKYKNENLVFSISGQKGTN